MSTSSETSQAEQNTELDPRRWLALFTLLLAGFMNLIDVTIVNVALPALERNLGANSSQIEWIVAGYVLAFALALLPLGRLGDIVGRRRVFLIGVGAFAVTSAICGLAPNIELLVAGRILQGFAGAAMMPQVLAIVSNIFPPQERGMAFSMFGLVASLAAVSGPLIGGALITADIAGLSWRPIFLINLPIGAFAVLAGLRLIPNIPGNREMRNDWLGIVLASIAVLCLVFALIEGRTFGWPLWIFALMIASIPASVAFVLWQRHQEKRGAPQLLPFALMTNRDFMLGTLATVAFFSGIPGFFMIFALFLQTGFGLTPLASGATTIPFPIGIFIASFASGRMGPRWMKQRLMVGAIVLALGMILIRSAILSVGDSVASFSFIIPLLVSGLGMGTTIAVLFQTVLSNVPARDSGSGSGALQAFQQMGGAIGVALIGQIFFGSLMGSGLPGHAAYVNAAADAMIYNIAMFIGVVVLAVFISTPKHTGAQGAPGRSPMPAEV